MDRSWCDDVSELFERFWADVQSALAAIPPTDVKPITREVPEMFEEIMGALRSLRMPLTEFAGLTSRTIRFEFESDLPQTAAFAAAKALAQRPDAIVNGPKLSGGSPESIVIDVVSTAPGNMIGPLTQTVVSAAGAASVHRARTEDGIPVIVVSGDGA
jgi:hypothetical protein